MSALVVTFLSHLEVPSAGALVFKSLRNGTVVVQSLMLDQLHDAEKDMHILKASQISVNSAVSRRVVAVWFVSRTLPSFQLFFFFRPVAVSVVCTVRTRNE